MEHERDGKRTGKGTGRIGNLRIDRNHLKFSPTKRDQNHEKNSRDLRELTVTRTSVKDYQQTPVWKTVKNYNNDLLALACIEYSYLIQVIISHFYDLKHFCLTRRIFKQISLIDLWYHNRYFHYIYFYSYIGHFFFFSLYLLSINLSFNILFLSFSLSLSLSLSIYIYIYIYMCACAWVCWTVTL